MKSQERVELRRRELIPSSLALPWLRSQFPGVKGHTHRARCKGWFVILLVTLGTLCAHAGNPKQIMIVNPFGGDTEPFATGASAFRTTLARELGEPVTFHEVPLDLARFNGQEGEGALVRFLEERIRDTQIDLVVLFSGASVQFAARHRERLFPDAPILVIGAEPRTIPAGFLSNNATLVTQEIDLPGMVEDILGMRPETSQIAMVFGSSPLEKLWVAECRRELQGFAGRVEFIWLDDLSLEEMLERCASLPPRSFILHGLFLIDVDGVPCEKNEALRRLNETANAPVFAVFQSEFGLGAIGGRLFHDSELGVRGAAAALRILRGERVEEIPHAILGAMAPRYDWRELRRWGIREANLPPGSVIEFREPGFWERYRWMAMIAFLIAGVQTALIAGLLASRSRRLRSEAEATLIAEISSKFVNLPAREVDREIMDAERRICELLDLDVAGLWQWSHEDKDSLRLTHLHGDVPLPPPDPMEAAEYFPWLQKEMLAGQVVVVSSLDRLPPEASRDRETLRTFGIKSCLVLPLSVGGEAPIGALGLNSSRRERTWPIAQIGRLEMIAQIFTNALARKRADQALRESDARLSLAADAADAGLWSLEWSKRVFIASERARMIFGYGFEDIISLERFEASIVPGDLGLVRDGINKSSASGEALDLFYRIRLENGRERWIRSRGRWHFKPDGEPLRLLGISMDITAAKQTELEVRELRDTLAHTGRVTLLGNLASALAHELSQPLGAILRNAEAAEIMLGQADPDMDELRAITEDILRDDHRAGQVIDKLRALLKRGTIVLKPVDLSSLITEVLSLVQTDAVVRHVKISSTVQPGLPRISCDGIHIQQVLLNLLANAMDALEDRKPEDRAVQVHARQTDASSVEVRVCDKGPGIADENIGRLFEPFFTTKSTGMGMGLPVSKTIIEAHKGRMWAENVPESGACFCFTLQAADV